VNELRKIRFLKGFSQAHLAKIIGIDAAMLSRLENDLLRDSPAVLRLKKEIAEILNAPVEVLFPGTAKQEKDR
jgi:transcriptional regulator with XRE-family HTH domain